MKHNVFGISRNRLTSLRFLTLLGYLGVFVALQQSAWSADCPGFCTTCRNDAITLCGAGCIQAYSCSLSTCTCSFSCKTTGGCPHASAATTLNDLRFERSSWNESENRYAPRNVRFEVIAQPDVPIVISNLTLQNDPGRQSSELSYTVNNQTGSDLREIRLLVTFFNDRNEPLGGECLTETLSTSAHGYHVRTPLSHYVDAGQRVVVGVTDFETDTRSWHGDHQEIIKAMKQL